MKYLSTLVLLLSLAGFSPLSAQSKSDAILGEWISELKDARINIYKQGDAYHGKIVWNKTPGRKDEKNPDSSLRNRDILGTVILKNFKYKDGSWEDGTIYDPHSGKTYSCILKTRDQHKVLDIRGYVGITLLGRTSLWTRP